MKDTNIKFREEWLTEATSQFVPWFKDRAGLKIPTVRVACGFPDKGAFSRKRPVIGQCWGGVASKDKIPQVFISPVLDDVTGTQGVLATLVHELEHATIGIEAKHGPKFSRAMLPLGLIGKPTSTEAGPELLEFIKTVAKKCGKYPHSPLSQIRGAKKQSTRLIKCSCGHRDCEYNIRITRKWLDEVGAPICPLKGHGEMVFDLKVLKGYEGEGEGDE